jgi:hypothetical protein
MPTPSKIAIDDVVEAASLGVLRALESRKIAGREFTQQNGFFVKFDLTAGGYPYPIDRVGGVLGQRGMGEVGQ